MNGNFKSKDIIHVLKRESCLDGTSYNQCSRTKPKYCENGKLINNCKLCGCPPPGKYSYMCQVNGGCKTVINRPQVR